jgi:hypothetical protein
MLNRARSIRQSFDSLFNDHVFKQRRPEFR